MSTKIFYFISILSIAAFAFSACNHGTDLYDGPNLIDRFGEFKVVAGLEVSQSTVDFAAGESVFFTAEFNKNIDWIIEIEGLESGAIKRLEGFDRFINMDNAVWTGGTTELPFFKIELCSITLTVPEEPGFSDSDEIEVLSTKMYESTLFSDFEIDQGAFIEVGNYEFELTTASGRQNNIQAAQGEYYWFLEGTDNVVSNFFVGLININAKVTGETYAVLPNTVPEDLYFNCFIHTDGGPHTIAVIQFVFDSNGSGAFEDGTDATFQIDGDFPLTGKTPGWHHFSHSMSEVGMSQAQLEKLVTIRVLLISDKNSQPDPPLQVDFGIDYLSFTEGGPLEL